MGESARGTLDTPLLPAPSFLRYRIAVNVSAEEQGAISVGYPGGLARRED